MNNNLRQLAVGITLIALGGCSGSGYKPNLKPGEQTAKIDYRAHYKGILYLAGDIECSSLLGLPNNQRKLTQIIYDSKSGNNEDKSVVIPVSDNQVFMANTEIPQSEQLKYFWFSFPIKANKFYKVNVAQSVDGKFLGINTYKYSINVLDELNQEVVIEKVSIPNYDKKCDSSYTRLKEPE